MNDDDDTEQRHLWLRHMKMDLYNVEMWQIISMLFIDQLKTSDAVHIEQAPIDDKKEETWPAFRQLLKRRRSICNIEKLVLCTTTTTTFIIVRIAGQVLDLNALSTMAMVPLSTDQLTLVRGCSRKRNRSIMILTSKRIDSHQRLFISRRWRYSCTCWKTNWI